MPYPTGADAAAFMVAQGLIKEPPSDMTALDIAAESAAEAWEGSTFWSPFLSSGVETKHFDGPEGFTLFPPVGIISITELRVDGYLLLEGTGFVLQHRRFGSKGPWQAIEFANPVRGIRRCVEVTGEFGYATELPADVRLAILSKAAGSAIAHPGFQGAIKKEKKGPVEYEYAVSDAMAASPAGQLAAAWDDTVKRYKRLM